MYKGCRIGVVVPAYNEALLIRRVITTMPEFVDRIYVVDDCSDDNTVALVRQLLDEPQHAARVELIVHRVNQGVGAAIVTGYHQAARDGMDVVAVMAGDAQMNPDELSSVVDPVCSGTADYVKGNRYLSGEAWERMPRYRYFGNACLSIMTKVASGYWHVGDAQTGYTAISRRAIEVMPLDDLYSRYGYPNHILVMLNVYRFRVVDVPIEPIYDIGEVSGIKLHQVIPRMSWLIVRKFAWRLREKRMRYGYDSSLLLFHAGVLLGTLALVLATTLGYRWFHTGLIPRVNAMALGFTLLACLQAVIGGMLLDIRQNQHLWGRTPRSTTASGTPAPLTPSAVVSRMATSSVSESEERRAA